MNQLAAPRTDQHAFAVMTGHGTEAIGLISSESFGVHAGLEPLLPRLAREAPRRSEQRYADILDTTMDAIIAIDQDHHITLFNRAAEQVFCCTAERAIGQAFDRFVPKRLRALLQDYLQGAELARQLWVPEGLTALRADGKEFPVEATISALRLNGRAEYTIILRDIDARAKAEASLRSLQSRHQSPRETIRRSQESAGVVGQTPAMQAVFEAVEIVAKTDSTVLTPAKPAPARS